MGYRGRVVVRFFFRMTYGVARRVVVTVVGGSVVLLGIALLVLPGPAFVVIPIGLAILGLEFAWARHWLQKIRETTEKAIRGKGGAGHKKREPYRTDYFNHDGP